MKSKIHVILIAFLMVLSGTTHTMGTFFTAARKIAFSKVMNRAQWALFTSDAAYKLFHIKGKFQTAESSLNALPDYDTFKTDYLAHRAEYPEHPIPQIPKDDLDRMNGSYVKNVINDQTVNVKYDYSSNNVVAARGPFTGSKYIVFPFYYRIPDGLIHHEYEHIKKEHSAKKTFLRAVAPLAMHTLFKSVRNGYKLMHYGYSAAKNAVPSIGSTLLKIPGTLLTFMSVPLVTAYQSRAYEYQADNVIPAELAGEVADFFETRWAEHPVKKTLLTKAERLLDTHPPMEERIKALRARAVAAQAKV